MNTQVTENKGELLGVEDVVPVSPNRGFELIRGFVDRYNSSAGDKAQKLDADTLIAALQDSGAVNDEILATLSATELTEAAALNKVLGKALHAELAPIRNETTVKPRRRVTRFGAQAMELDQLVRSYDPMDVGNAVNTELKKRLKDATGRDPKVIVFDDNGAVLADITLGLIGEALQGDPDLNQTEADGKIRYTYKVGEQPQKVVETHCLTGEVLRSNGIGKDGLDWSMVSLEAKQLLHLAKNETEELPETLSRRELVYYHSKAASKDGLVELQREFPEATREYMERFELDCLPKFKKYRREAPRKAKSSSDRLFRS